jgi:hypothetical protein
MATKYIKIWFENIPSGNPGFEKQQKNLAAHFLGLETG